MKTKSKWRDKLLKPEKPEIKKAPPEWIERFHGEKMLIATPILVKKMIEAIPPGKLATPGIIAEALARKFDADFTCPLTTGIFIRIVAEAAEEAKSEGALDITPYWRVINKDGSLNEKFPGGSLKQSEYLAREGHSMINRKRSRKLFVEDFSKKTIRPTELPV